MLRTNSTTQEFSSVRLRSDVASDVAVKGFSSVKLIEHSTQKIDPAAAHDLVVTHKDPRFAVTSKFLKT